MRNAMENRLKLMEERGMQLPTAAALAGVFVYYCFAHGLSASGAVSNITLYVLSAGVFFLILAAGALVLSFAPPPRPLSEGGERRAALFFLALGAVFLVQCYRHELDAFAYPAGYFRHSIPLVLYLPSLAAAVAGAWLTIRDMKDGSPLRRMAFAAFLSVIQGWFLYAPHPFADTGGGIYHIDAYTNSIINTLYGAPMEMESASIYGHYALLCLLPVKLLIGLGLPHWKSVTFVVACAGIVTFFLAYRVFDRVIKNDGVYLLSLLAAAVISFQIYSGQYYQVLPHRLLFQSVMLWGCILAFRHRESRLLRLVLWVLAGLAMLWNVETGAVVTAVWTLGAVYLDACRKGRYSLAMLLKNVLFAVLAFLGGWGLVNGYNLLVGGNPISLGTYVYPIGSESYDIRGLALPLMTPDNGYFLVVALCLGFPGLHLLHGLYLRMTQAQYTVFLAGVMGLGMFTYYMNRAVTPNASIAVFSTVLLLAHVCDRTVPDLVRELQALPSLGAKLRKALTLPGAAGLLSLVVLSGLVLASVCSVGASLRLKTETTWNGDDMTAFLTEAKAAIPDDAAAFGAFTPPLFAMLDRTTGIYLCDFEDMGQSPTEGVVNREAVDALERLLRENRYEHLVVNEDAADFLPPGEYAAVDEFSYHDGFHFTVYERIR